ncbi:SDR family NAD(P)-dependent oxidoreductase [Nocardioides anomalus]|uniref:SDR family NAD(P)-dependent oxidoreductase n=1 Tax=Nocardioides anomalus TaxID=2712223 RepID=A0A6G6WF49_9ACTN|nr:SDR family NAD(P)-dependent oxidoreductase [Nocardioides anomalus]QIG43783.1 SDR family NAD(P)-dependent oxidoreductase [Nocardioides anomalus]
MAEERVAVVTGVGDGSLGEATARALRERGFRVLTSTRTCATTDDTHALELTSRDSVDGFADWVERSSSRLDVLVNNAGVHLDLRSAWHEPHLVDGYEVHWRTNYLGTAQLTRRLLPLLLATAGAEGEARVVEVVSQLHARGRNEGLDGHLSPYDSWAAYGTSKLALVHEAHEIERRYGAQGLHAYSVHPGAIATKIADRGLETAPLLARLRKLAAPLERRALLTPDDGARTVVFCATSPLAEPGGYHRASAPAAASEDARDEEAGRILWDATTRWVERGERP